MAKNLKTILSKKSWTGEEVGRALIANLMNDIKCIGQDPEPLFSQGELDTMTNSLSDEQYNNLRPYHRLHAILHESYNFLQAKHQQFYNGYYRLLNYLKTAEAVEVARAQAEKYPLILSAEKYAELSRIAYEERKNTVSDIYSAIITHLSQTFMEYLDGDNAVPAEFITEIEKLKKEPATDPAIIKKCDEVSPRGMYILQTGEKSCDYAKEEWESIVRAAFNKVHGIESEEQAEEFRDSCISKGQKAYYRGKAYTIRQMKKEGIDTACVERISAKDIKHFLYVITRNEVRRGELPVPEPTAAAGVVYRYVYGADSPVTWIRTKSRPTKYEIIKAAVKDALSFVSRVDNVYYEVYGAEGGSAAVHFAYDYYNLMKWAWDEVALRADFLFNGEKLDDFEIIKKAVESGNVDGVSMLRGKVSANALRVVDVNGYQNLIVDANVYDIYQYIVGLEQSSVRKHEMEYSLLFNGFAIIQKGSGLYSNNVDKHIQDGIFLPSDIINDSESIESWGKKADTRSELKQIQHNLIEEALRYLYSYNAFVEIIENVYDLELTEAKASMEDIEEKLKKVRKLLYFLYMDATGTTEERAAKQKIIKSLFEDLEIDDYKPDKERIEHTISKYKAQETYKEKLDNLRTYESDILYLAEKGEAYE